MTRIGIDEAGRGPVLGPLVITGVKIPLEDHDELRHIGVNDSKYVQKQKREKLAVYLQQKYCSHTVFISAKKIDCALKKGISLNTVEEIAMKSILSTFPNTKAVIDCPIKNTEKWEDKFKQDVTAENRADQNHVDVGAASIIAKTKRDHYIERILDEKAGSGYPSDPTTKKFLETIGLTHIEIRRTWKTIKRIQAQRTQQKLI